LQIGNGDPNSGFHGERSAAMMRVWPRPANGQLGEHLWSARSRRNEASAPEGAEAQWVAPKGPKGWAGRREVRKDRPREQARAASARSSLRMRLTWISATRCLIRDGAFFVPYSFWYSR